MLMKEKSLLARCQCLFLDSVSYGPLEVPLAQLMFRVLPYVLLSPQCLCRYERSEVGAVLEFDDLQECFESATSLLFFN